MYLNPALTRFRSANTRTQSAIVDGERDALFDRTHNLPQMAAHRRQILGHVQKYTGIHGRKALTRQLGMRACRVGEQHHQRSGYMQGGTLANFGSDDALPEEEVNNLGKTVDTIWHSKVHHIGATGRLRQHPAEGLDRIDRRHRRAQKGRGRGEHGERMLRNRTWAGRQAPSASPACP